MKNWLIFSLALVILVACSKFTNPKRVERKITKGSWKIASFATGGVSSADSFATYSFNFDENQNVIVTSTGGFKGYGSWSLGLDKKPTILYLNFPPQGNLDLLADDWQVLSMTKNSLKLKRNDSSTGSTLSFFQ